MRRTYRVACELSPRDERDACRSEKRNEMTCWDGTRGVVEVKHGSPKKTPQPRIPRADRDARGQGAFPLGNSGRDLAPVRFGVGRIQNSPTRSRRVNFASIDAGAVSVSRALPRAACQDPPQPVTRAAQNRERPG